MNKLFSFFNTMPGGTGSPEFERSSFESGTFSNAVQKNYKETHALQVIRAETTSSFVLELNADGSAFACRGWQYLFFNSGPEVNETEHIREQFGYNGKWRHDQTNGWFNVTLLSGGNFCPPVKEYSNMVPHHANEWQLSCFPFVLKNQPEMNSPLLACRFIDMNLVFAEDEPHVVPDPVHQQHWLLLGGGNGLKIKQETTLFNNNKTEHIELTMAPDMIRSNAWEHSF